MNAEEDVLAAARVIVEAFASWDRDRYFACFHPHASFIFHNHPERLDSRREYEALFDEWTEQEQFRVVSCTSTQPQVQVFGDTAVFTHRVTTQTAPRDGAAIARERETIVFLRLHEGWTAIHEHLSVDSDK